MGILALFNRGLKRSRRLYSEARELIDAERFEDALRIGRKLRKLRYSGAYEVEGLAYAGLKRHEDAVRVLREGLGYAPNVWLNWHLLGNCLSDLRRFDEALAAFDQAVACSEVDMSFVNLDRAVVAVRAEDYSRALEWLEDVHADTLRIPMIATAISALRGLERHDEALELAEQILRAWSEAGRLGDERTIGEIAASAARIRRNRGESPLSIRVFAIDYWRLTANRDLLWLIRDLFPQLSSFARYFRMVLHARTSENTGFFVSTDVVADDVEEAMRFLREIADFDGAETVTAEEVTDMGPHGGPKGVYAVHSRSYYRETAE